MFKKSALIALAITGGVTSGAIAQNGPQPVQMIMLRVEHNQGKDFIITPKGFRAQVPGKGISSNAQNVAVYQDNGGNYWYIDKHGQPTPVKPEVLRSVMSQVQAEAQASGMMPQGGQPGMAPGMASGMAPGMVSSAPPTQQTTIIQQPASSGGGGSGMAGAASMAMSGAAMGMSIGALANSGSHYGYYGVPYGHPIYNEGGNKYYYNDINNHHAYVSPNKYNSAYFNQFNKQGTWNNREQWQKNVQAVNPATRENLQNEFKDGEHRFAGRGFRRR